jgi:asparagine synthetase B (glutamine-hydrolysing)
MRIFIRAIKKVETKEAPMLVDIGSKRSAAQAQEQVKFDIFEHDVAIAFFDMRGLPPVFDAQEAVRCYRKQGVEALKSLCAQYACVICDLRHQRVIFSSDSVGHTTFFYHVDGGRVLVSDTLRSISSRVPLGIDRQSFEMYITCDFVPGGRTIYKNIYKLSPGGYISVEKGRAQLGSYAKVPRVVHGREDELRSVLQKSLTSSVSRTILRPTGVMFSGGFDSSFLCQLVRSYQKQVRTYAIGCQGYNQATLDQGLRMARVLGSEHVILDITVKEYLAALRLTARLMDEPIVDLDTAFIYSALRKAPKGERHLLHGFGSDQLIGDSFGDLRGLVGPMAVFPDLHRYGAMKDRDRAAGLFFIRGKMPQEVRLHYRLSGGTTPRLIFPFFEQSLVRLALQMPEGSRRHKELLRSLAPSLNKILPFGRVKREKGQIPAIVKDLTLRVYGENLIQSCLLGDLMGKTRLSRVLSSKNTDGVVKLAVFSLWVKENHGHPDALAAR